VAPLLAVPNVSEGRDRAAIDAIAAAFEGGGARVLDVHSDPDHHRSVFTMAGEPGRLASAVLAGARAALVRVDITRHEGQHPRVGAVDVAPIVYLGDDDRGAACAEALVLADGLGGLGLPTYLYGDLAGGRTRAELRRPGGLAGADFGPQHTHPTGGATLVAARPPLVAFNVEIEGTLDQAKDIARRIREGGPEGLPGVRALGVHLASRDVAQVTTNIEHTSTPRQVVEAVARHASVREAELVALAPEAAFADFPADVHLRGFHPQRHLIERALS
jgi:glutamate formiminotransferase